MANNPERRRDPWITDNKRLLGLVRCAETERGLPNNSLRNDSEIGRMEAPARNISQAEAPISQHMENTKKYNGSDLPTRPPTPQGGGGGRA